MWKSVSTAILVLPLTLLESCSGFASPAAGTRVSAFAASHRDKGENCQFFVICIVDLILELC